MIEACTVSVGLSDIREVILRREGEKIVKGAADLTADRAAGEDGISLGTGCHAAVEGAGIGHLARRRVDAGADNRRTKALTASDFDLGGIQQADDTCGGSSFGSNEVASIDTTVEYGSLTGDTGDVAKMIYPDNGLPYLENLFGRRMDLIYDTKGDVVSPFLLCRTMRLSHGVEQWQFIQKTETEYIIRIAVNKGEKPILDKEINMFRDTLGETASISVEYVDEIPVMNSLKRKLIVSEIHK